MGETLETNGENYTCSENGKWEKTCDDDEECLPDQKRGKGCRKPNVCMHNMYNILNICFIILIGQRRLCADSQMSRIYMYFQGEKILLEEVKTSPLVSQLLKVCLEECSLAMSSLSDELRVKVDVLPSIL